MLRGVLPAMARVQAVVEQAKATFGQAKGTPGFDGELTRLKAAITALTPDDFKITPALADKQWNFFPYVMDAPASCMEVFECSDFSIGIFLLKPKKSMPFHDHPGMHGVMKVLFGSMTVTSYTKSPDATDQPPFPCRCASKLEVDSTSEPCTLYPDDGNIHEIVASELLPPEVGVDFRWAESGISEPVAFLDVLAPPYSPSQGRDCTYYSEKKPDGAQGQEGITWLQPGPNPSWFSCIPLPYSGPKVQ